jgi:Raf kinase inhibitor-like YbhB/YbcL family protein
VRWIVPLCLGILLACVSTAVADGIFQVSSSAFADGDIVPATFAFSGIGIDKTQCGGQNQSPPLAWSNAPAGTKSFAVVIFDVDGFFGQGVTHWVAYNIAPSQTTVAQGAGTAPDPPFTSGKQSYGQIGFRGFCPPKGQSLHHYVVTVYALDLPPALAPGMTRAELLAAIDQHVLRLSSIVARFAR